MGESQPSVLTQEPITKGTLLGPLSLSPTSVDPLALLAWRCQDQFPDTRHVIKVYPRDQDNEWLIHVQSARDSEEQNLEVIVKSGHLYYRAIRDISAEEELFVWFGEDLNDILQLPMIPSTTVDGNKRYYCILCQKLFKYPNSVISHLLYRCERRNLPPVMETSTKTRTKVKSFDIASLTTTENDVRPAKRLMTDSSAPIKYDDCPQQMDVSSNSFKIPALGSESNNLSAFKKVDKSHSFNIFPRLPSDVLPTTTSYPLPPYPAPSSPQDSTTLVTSLTSAFVPAHLGEPLDKVKVRYESRALIPAPFSSRSSNLHLPYSKPFPSPVDNFTNKTLPSALLSFLPPSLAALTLPAQNWCAKCNASFRMTSDLVYHMRSHHKREADATKQRREEKLKCNICNETFRERHHLTRHMTSHQ